MSREGSETVTREKHARQSDRKEQGMLRPLLALPSLQITRDKVVEWLAPKAEKRPTRTGLALSLLSTFLTIVWRQARIPRPSTSERVRENKAGPTDAQS